MTKQFDILRMYRAGLLNIVKDLPIEMLNEIPKGFNNNLIWNLGHVLVTQQMLCYRLPQLPMALALEEDFIKRYVRGTKPETFIEEVEINFITEALMKTLETMENEHQQGFFNDYKPFNLRANLELTTVNDAFLFNLSHEALHYGAAIALKKILFTV